MRASHQSCDPCYPPARPAALLAVLLLAATVDPRPSEPRRELAEVGATLDGLLLGAPLGRGTVLFPFGLGPSVGS